jgi:protein SCO1/2
VEQLGDKAEKTVPLFITFDPARDTLPILKDYVSNFHPSILGLTGTPAETDVAAKTFRAFFRKEKSDDNVPRDYLVSHTSAFYVIDPKDNIWIRQSKYGTTPDQVFAALAKIL